MIDLIAKVLRSKASVEAALPVPPNPAAASRDQTPAAAPPLGPDCAATPMTRLFVGAKAFDHLMQEIGEAATLEVIGVFVKETRVRLELLGSLKVSTDRGRIEREAHSLKSAAATFGLDHLSGLARELEHGTQCADDAAYLALLDRIKAAFAAAHSRPDTDHRMVALSG
ncbi:MULTISPECIES: Hpt domain-containing protein [Rhodopseudomonas]|uniref:Hpt domain-containing protein n=1 Tax=Rhodopseudomonas TaxID=1073 RepID=UPI000698503F|nr:MULTISPECIES: Hpt domain-containing protein [Rhodopseudomonas]MDF3809896.1 Hpt domain-containing protein [Rhodopseudomonas sp. BAL398]WOK17931.1 Hpt domain-containing protein [Rhodopseudomonas sp. BAL398]